MENLTIYLKIAFSHQNVIEEVNSPQKFLKNRYGKKIEFNNSKIEIDALKLFKGNKGNQKKENFYCEN